MSHFTRTYLLLLLIVWPPPCSPHPGEDGLDVPEVIPHYVESGPVGMVQPFGHGRSLAPA